MGFSPTLLSLSLFLLTSCLAPDGSTVTMATVDADNRVQVQTVSIDAEQEFYRGFFTMCLFVTAVESGAGDVPGCTELAAKARVHDTHLDASFIEYWRWDLVQQ